MFLYVCLAMGDYMYVCLLMPWHWGTCRNNDNQIQVVFIYGTGNWKVNGCMNNTGQDIVIVTEQAGTSRLYMYVRDTVFHFHEF